MLKITKEPNNIFLIEISLPRMIDDEVQFIDFLKNVFKHKRFGLILSVEGEKAFSHEAKKDLGLWFRQFSSDLENQCLGFARIDIAAEQSKNFTKKSLINSMPCPYQVFSCRLEAYQWFENLV